MIPRLKLFTFLPSSLDNWIRLRHTSDLSEVDVSDKARNFGVVMDKHMTLSTHINNVCRSASYAISKIGQIRRFID